MIFKLLQNYRYWNNYGNNQSTINHAINNADIEVTKCIVVSPTNCIDTNVAHAADGLEYKIIGRRNRHPFTFLKPFLVRRLGSQSLHIGFISPTSILTVAKRKPTTIHLI